MVQPAKRKSYNIYATIHYILTQFDYVRLEQWMKRPNLSIWDAEKLGPRSGTIFWNIKDKEMNVPISAYGMLENSYIF